jgi:hypothetical protein
MEIVDRKHGKFVSKSTVFKGKRMYALNKRMYALNAKRLSKEYGYSSLPGRRIVDIRHFGASFDNGCPKTAENSFIFETLLVKCNMVYAQFLLRSATNVRAKQRWQHPESIRKRMASEDLILSM